MGMRTGRIRYNVRERGRRFRGQDRAFDTAALAQLINSGSVQERVKNGDMVGYYGHWPRQKFGLNPTEGGLVDGRAVALEPAIRTVYLKAYDDGTIEHEVEFLDTNAGRLAERLYKSKTGGFSSAIEKRSAGGRDIPQGFYGFDFVLEPNYTTNRGYALDGISEEDLAVLDEVSEYNQLLESTNRILDQVQQDYESLQKGYELLAQTAARLEAENIQYQSMLAKQTGKAEVVMDGLVEVVHGSRPPKKFEFADSFKDADLVPVEKAPETEPVMDTAADKYFARQWRM